MSIEFKGLDEVLGQLEDFADTSIVTEALTKSCMMVEAAAKQNAPKGSGELRRSITSKVESFVGEIFTPLEYAPYVEYGTGLFAESGGRQDVPWRYQDEEGEWHSTYGQNPQPYMRPALNENKERILKLFKEAYKNA